MSKPTDTTAKTCQQQAHSQSYELEMESLRQRILRSRKPTAEDILRYKAQRREDLRTRSEALERSYSRLLEVQ